jgi:ABC-type Mn2+/Zn2+ transport system permease subunit
MTFINSLTDFLEYDFLTFALIGTVLLSILCGLISPLIIARKSAFMGSAISHSSLLGLAIALSIFNSTQNVPIFLTTLFITLLTSLFLAKSTYKQVLPTDSLIGIFYTSTMALGIVIHGLFSKTKGDLLGFLFGNILLLTKDDIIISTSLLVLVIPIILIPFAKWIFITFDEEGATSSGINVAIYHYLFFIILSLLIVTSIKIAGTILIETLLLVPGFFALSLNQSIKRTFFLSVLFSLVFAIIGLSLANFLSLPSGATLAIVQFSALLVSIGIKKIYNLIYN